MTNVTMKTSKAPHIPWANGCSVSAVACAIGAVPMPASLENMPRAIPACTACITAAPAKPPIAGAGAKAWRTIIEKTSGIAS